MKKLKEYFLKHFDKICAASGIIACIFYVYKNHHLWGTQFPLGKITIILFSGSLLPIGILFILCAFDEELYFQKVLENKIGLVAAGFTIIYAALNGIILI